MSATPPGTGGPLFDEIEAAPAISPTLWWLGHAGFALKYHSMVFYIDPVLSEANGRSFAPLMTPGEVTHAELILCTHAHPRHMDSATLLPMLEASQRAKLVLPKSAAEKANTFGIGYDRMTTTDSGLRVEYFKTGDYVRVYSVPSAHPELDYTPIGGYPYLGYLIRCGGITIYHAGDCVPYADLAARLKPYSVDVALLPISGRKGNGCFTIAEAAQLAEDIGASWLLPMHYGLFPDSAEAAGAFIHHMLFHRPAQRFKVFQPGEGWEVP
ncbi:MAG: MBL fold metallo-hydrolase [Acidimicrobiia bacterium]|nr:MBL fold metallo-hydrolase [Acidimicrobiia bacterium]